MLSASLPNSHIKIITEMARCLCRQFQNKWQSCNITLNGFLSRYKEWLQNSFKVCISTRERNLVVPLSLTIRNRSVQADEKRQEL